MSRYEWMKCCGVDGMNLGIVSPDVFAKFIRFNLYIQFLSDGNQHKEAIFNASERSKCSEKTIERAIEFFRDTLVS